MAKTMVTFDRPIAPVQEQARIVEIQQVHGDYLDILLENETIAAHALPGQFVMLRGWQEREPILFRPFDIVQVKPANALFRIVVKVMGKGTTLMQKLRVNDEIPVTGPLGNGISELNCSSIGLLTRGVGAAAVVLLAEKAAVENISVYAFLSASTANRLVCREYVEKAATEFFIATDDGSEGYHGDARDMMKNFLSERTPDQVYTCGSKRFARYTQQLTDDGLTEGYLFLEEYMACGVGYCHGCAVRQRNSDKYFLVCEHGPVFRADEVEVE